MNLTVLTLLVFALPIVLGGSVKMVEMDTDDGLVPKAKDGRKPMKGDRYKNYHCLYLPGYQIPSKKKEACCALAVKRYYRKWYYGRSYLTTFLDTLKQWNCTQLEKQCKRRYFDVTPFTKVVYMRVCEPEKYRESCFDTVKKLSPNADFAGTNITEKNWKSMVSALNSKSFSDEELQEPCTQVALYESDRSGHGRFHESIESLMPFCGIVWCGYDADTVYGRKITTWTCMPRSCRIGIGIATALIGLLGVATLLANMLIVAVYWYKKRMNNSQIVYKVTLAIGDSLVGVIVFPTFISTFFMQYLSRHFMGGYMKLNDISNNTLLEPKRLPGGMVNSFPQPYLNAVGFFTSLSIIISIYTLMLASFDRMSAVCRPMSYDRRRALHFAKYSCAIMGLIGLVVATLPIYTRHLEYGLVASIMVSLTGQAALIFYAVVLLLPLVLVWVSTIILFIYSKRHTRVRRRISSVSNAQVTEAEHRLAKTLGVMVGVFTATIIPAVATILTSFFVSDIYYHTPESFNNTSATVYTSAEFISIIILTTNSLWNCFIYGARDKDFGKITKDLLSMVSNKAGISKAMNSLKKGPSSRRFTSSSITSNSTAVFTTKAKLSVSSDRGHDNPVMSKSSSTSSEENGRESLENATKEKNKSDVNENKTWYPAVALDAESEKVFQDQA